MKSDPAAQRAPSRPSPFISMRAAWSKTAQTASPRRKTAAPTGPFQAKRSTVCWPLTSAATGTAPPMGTGEGRELSARAPGA
ncbi:hypothetical protein D3C80_1155860 [compost metagenome]